MPKIAVKILILAVVTLLSVNFSYADIDGMGADYLVETGEIQLEHGNIQDAIHEFSKALMINPTHKKAKQHLQEYGLDKGLYEGIKTSTKTIADMATNVKEYKQQVKALDQKKGELEHRYSELEKEQESLAKATLAKSLEIEEYQKKLDKLEMTINNDRINYTRKLKVEKDRYDINIASLKHNRQSLDQMGKNHTTDDQALKYEKDLKELTYKYTQAKEDAYSVKSKRDDFYQALEDHLYIHRHKVGRLEEDILYKEIKLVKLENQLLKALDESDSLHQTNGQYRERLHKRNRLIVEKRKDVAYLKSQVDKINKELRDAKKTLNQLQRNSDQTIEGLEKEIQSTR